MASGVSARAPATAPIPWAVTSTDVPRAPSWSRLMATAGIRAMNGEMRRAVMPIRVIASRQPGSAIAPRKPATIWLRSVVFSGSWGRSANRLISRATMTAPNEAALRAKTRL